jgi:peptidoglycan/xylan/chitin deacetylase (PgdA/CDA1 family)
MKQAVLGLMRMTGAFATCRLANRRKVLILTYHRFSAHEAEGAVSASLFARQLAYLRAHYTIGPLSAVERHLTAGDRLPYPAVALTIDDGYRDAYEIAFSILRRFDAPATLFAVSDFIDGKCWLWTDKVRYIVDQTKTDRVSANVAGSVIEMALNGSASRREAEGRVKAVLKSADDHVKEEAIESLAEQTGVELPRRPPPDCGPVTWDELREMDAGGVEIGSHTVTHPILPRVDRKRLIGELRTSRRRLEEMLDHEVSLFCYPNGDYDRQVRDEVERAGYRLAVTAQPGMNAAGCDPLSLRRIHTEFDVAHFIQTTSGFEQLKTSVRRSIRRRAAEQ